MRSEVGDWESNVRCLVQDRPQDPAVHVAGGGVEHPEATKRKCRRRLTGQRDAAGVKNLFALLFRQNAIHAFFPERSCGRLDRSGKWGGRNSVES